MAERKRPGQTEPKDEAGKNFDAHVTRYQRAVERSGVMERTLIGGKAGLRTAYIWHIVSGGFPLSSTPKDSQLRAINLAASRLRHATQDHIPLRIAQVASINAHRLEEQYRQAGFQWDVIEHTPRGYATDPSRESTEPLEVLISGLPYRVPMETAHLSAERARQELGEDPDYRDIFGLTVAFGKMRDRQAAAMLEDITLARNAAIEGGYARGFQLLGEPDRVLRAMGTTVLDLKPDLITVLDVQGAIESGALAPYFPSQQGYARDLGRYHPKKT